MRLKDADKLIELIDDDIASLDKNMSREGYDVCLCTLEMVKQYIKALPTIKPTKHGRWKHHQYGNTAGYYECDNCGKINSYESNYCPKCGADMREVEDG